MSKSRHTETQMIASLKQVEAGLHDCLKARFSDDPEPFIAAFHESFPNSPPWDIFVLIAAYSPHSAYAQEMAKQ